jgi:quercetin dioxygenase-like cupin family protein
MAGVQIVRGAEKEWREVPQDWPGRAKEGEPRVIYKTLMARGPGVPNMQRSRYEPHHFEPPHSHDEDEVIYLLTGFLELGDVRLDVGDAIYVPKNTRYSLRAGEGGAEFLRVGLPL